MEMRRARAFYPCLDAGRPLLGEQALIFDQHGGKLTRRDLHACRLQHLQDLGLTHLPCVVHRYHTRSHLWPKLAMVSCWNIFPIRPLVPRRVVFFFAEFHVVTPTPQILHHYLPPPSPNPATA